MKHTNNIENEIEEYIIDLRLYCNRENGNTIKRNIPLGSIGKPGAEDYTLIRASIIILAKLNSYLRITRNKKDNIDLQKIKNVLEDFIFDFDTRRLIIFDAPTEDHYKDLQKVKNNVERILEIIIEEEDNYREIDNKAKPVSVVCKDVNSRFATSLFLEVLKNAEILKNVNNKGISIIMSKLTGYKKITFETNLSKHRSDHEKEANLFINNTIDKHR